MVMTATFTSRGTTAAEFTIDIDRGRVGSRPTLQFIAGVLRHLPGLQGLPDTLVTIGPDLTSHHATYRLTLPEDGRRLARARRVLRTVGGAAAALDELEQQATEIAAQNQALTQQLAETEQAAAAAQIREAWLALALEAGQVGTWRYRLDARVVWVSDALGRTLGLAGDAEHPADQWAARILPEDRPHISRVLHQALTRRRAVRDRVPASSARPASSRGSRSTAGWCARRRATSRRCWAPPSTSPRSACSTRGCARPIG
jgi:PAS domain-containing protein